MTLDQYSNLARAIPNVWKTATTVATIFLFHWMSNSTIRSVILTDCGPQLTLRLFQAMRTELDIIPLRNTKYRQQKSWKLEQYNATIFAVVHDYVSEHHSIWESYVTPLTYVYRVLVQRYTELIPSTVVSSPYLPATASSSTTSTMMSAVNNIDSLIAIRISYSRRFTSWATRETFKSRLNKLQVWSQQDGHFCLYICARRVLICPQTTPDNLRLQRTGHRGLFNTNAKSAWPVPHADFLPEFLNIPQGILRNSVSIRRTACVTQKGEAHC